jgi:hypothetical protein
LPTRGLYPGLPTTTVHGERQIGFRGGDLVSIDIASGATLHRAAALCTAKGPHHELIAGNPQVDPTGTKILATCNGDGVMVDAASFKRLRTYPHLVPGCDNGEFLPAHFTDDGSELILHGCDGEADLDLKTGKFVCSDRDELMGAADPLRKPTGASKVVPPGRAAHGIPACPDSIEADSENGRELNEDWTAFETSDPPVVVGPAQQKIPFEPWMAKMKIAPKGDRFLIVSGTHVLVYNMADRKLISELVF